MKILVKLFTLFCCIALLTSISFADPALDFRSEDCDQKVNAYNDLVLEKSNSTIWKNENTLLIERHVRVNCADVIENGNYSIKDNELLLTYNTIKCSPCAKCICAKKLIYEISNLEKKDYKIIFKELF